MIKEQKFKINVSASEDFEGETFITFEKVNGGILVKFLDKFEDYVAHNPIKFNKDMKLELNYKRKIEVDEN